jgi:hypothetical protein
VTKRLLDLMMIDLLIHLATVANNDDQRLAVKGNTDFGRKTLLVVSNEHRPYNRFKIFVLTFSSMCILNI